jgi:hypothetical protein
MKVVCINNLSLGKDSNGVPRVNKLPLTIGKVYDIEKGITFTRSIGPEEVYIVERDNNGERRFYNTECFENLDIWRESQLNKIL